MRVTRCSDVVLDGSLIVLATWTLVYHLALLVGLAALPALAVEAVVLAAIALVARRQLGRPTAAAPPPAPTPTPEPVAERSATPLVVITAAGALVAAVAMAVSAPWGVVWPFWLLAAAAGTLAAARGIRRAPGALTADDGTPRTSRAEVAVVLAWAVGLAVLSVIVLRPNPDDLFYVNVSQWVAVHGTFPVCDTLFSDLTYPMANWPPLASYDGLVGALAHLTGRPAGDVVYVVVPPIATALAVLALWRLLRTWGVRRRALALSLGLVFLLADGTSGYAAPGNLFVTRLWQGKVILLCVVVPLLLVHALRFVERPGRQRAGWLFLGGVAAVGLSTTAMFLVPLIALAGAAPLARRAPRAALAGFAAMAAYPVAGAVLTLAVGGRSADDFGGRRLYRFEPAWFGPQVFLTGVVAAVGVAAVLLGAVLVPHRAARVTAGLMAVFVGITFVPGVTRLSYDLVGIGPTLWRVTWGCAVGALVGVALASALDRILRARPARPARPAWTSWAAAAVVGGVLLAAGHPVLAPDTTTHFVLPPHWQRGPDTRSVVSWMLARSAPGDRVLVPEGLGVSVAVTSTDLRTVAPRTYAMSYLRAEPSFDYPDRLVLQDLVNDIHPATPARVRSALAALHVRIACVSVDDDAGALTLARAGYRTALTTSAYRCLTPAGTPS